MEHSCALDVAEEVALEGGELGPSEVGAYLGLSRDRVWDAELRAASKVRAALLGYAWSGPPQDPVVRVTLLQYRLHALVCAHHAREGRWPSLEVLCEAAGLGKGPVSASCWWADDRVLLVDRALGEVRAGDLELLDYAVVDPQQRRPKKDCGTTPGEPAR